MTSEYLKTSLIYAIEKELNFITDELIKKHDNEKIESILNEYIDSFLQNKNYVNIKMKQNKYLRYKDSSYENKIKNEINKYLIKDKVSDTLRYLIINNINN